jgi:geranyl-CoA carboxylase alpha subunit
VQLVAALSRTQLLGLPSNRRLLSACLDHPEFRAGRALIPFLAGHGGGIREVLQKEERLALVPCGLAAIFSPKGAPGGLLQPFERPLRLRHRGELLELRVREAEGVAATTCAAVRLRDGRWHAQAGAVDLFFEDASHDPPGPAAGGAGAAELRAPFNGKVIAVKTAPGDRVARGDTLVVLESMKLEHALAAPRDGVVQAVLVEAGQQAAPTQVLLVMEPL